MVNGLYLVNDENVENVQDFYIYFYIFLCSLILLIIYRSLESKKKCRVKRPSFVRYTKDPP